MSTYATELRRLAAHVDRLVGTPAGQQLLVRAQVITPTGRLKKDLVSPESPPSRHTVSS